MAFRSIVEVLLVKVRFVLVLKFQTVPLTPVSVHVPLPMVIERVLELVDETKPTVMFRLLALNTPSVIVNVAVAPVANASASVTASVPVPLTVKLPQVFPADVTVTTPAPLDVILMADVAALTNV